MQAEKILQVGRAQLDALPAISALLPEWYGKSKRSMPWRENATPYRVWVSEIMLQQTRVEAVRGHFARFTEALPDIPSLAGASDDLLLKLWEGLGYYSRVRNMKRAALLLMLEYGGMLPASYTQLRALPGIGDYTAGAIASIAFGIPVPAVDGNVLRVLARVLESYADISAPAVKKAMRDVAASIVPPERPGDFNQSLMELGATVCLPNVVPLCDDCPIPNYCNAHQSDVARELPVLPAKKARRTEARTIVLIVAQNRVLLWKRKTKGLLAGMYEPLNLESVLPLSEVSEKVGWLGGNLVSITPLRKTKHIFTHIEWQMQAYEVVVSQPFSPPETLWADAAMLRADCALPSAFRVYMQPLLERLEHSDNGKELVKK